MNPYIPKLLRARYAMNMILSITQDYEGAWDKCTRAIDDFVAELDLPLFEYRNGKRIALNGDYVSRIFMDMHIRTGINIEELNLRKRIMGIYGTIETYTPNHINRDALIIYLGIESWNTLEIDAEILSKQLSSEVRHNIHSSCFGIATISYAIKPNTLNEGDEVHLIMSQGTSVIFLCLGDCLFKVKNVKGLSIHKDDILHITPPFIRKNRLYADALICYGKDKGEYLSEHTILDYKLTKGEISKLKDRDKAMTIIEEAERRRKEREENARG